MSNDPKNSLYDDSWHRPHGDHKGETPNVHVDRGPEGLSVTLDTWGPNDGKLLATIYHQAQSNWGDRPGTGGRDVPVTDADMTEVELRVIAHIMQGKHLQNALELISFGFTVNGCTRACTHEMVRTRVGASFAQHGGRDNDWRHRHWTLPETLGRVFDNENMNPDDDTAANMAEDFSRYAGELGVHIGKVGSIGGVFTDMLKMNKALYAALVDNGIPWQDARRILGIGHQTYLHANYNFLALRGVLAHRMEHGAVDWEIDCVAQLMRREVYLKCPRVIAHALGSHSDKAGVNKFANLYSWPPNGKWPNPKDWDATRPNQFTREQMPFWVLDPRCLVEPERDIEWIPTDGTFPWTEYLRRAASVLTELQREY